jgi:crossover junction endodeoxyribonuclease RuvC
MRVLGIDPGYDRLGLAILEGGPGKPKLIWSMCVEPAKGEATSRLKDVYEAVTTAIKDHSPDTIAIESLFFCTNKKTAIQVAEARGAILSAIGASGHRVQEYSPNQIKVAVTGHGAADKLAVARMIPRLIELTDAKRRDDELDAIAIGLTCLAMGTAHTR